jgi:hypothetical protein
MSLPLCLPCCLAVCLFPVSPLSPPLCVALSLMFSNLVPLHPCHSASLSFCLSLLLSHSISPLQYSNVFTAYVFPPLYLPSVSCSLSPCLPLLFCRLPPPAIYFLKSFFNLCFFLLCVLTFVFTHYVSPSVLPLHLPSIPMSFLCRYSPLCVFPSDSSQCSPYLSISLSFLPSVSLFVPLCLFLWSFPLSPLCLFQLSFALCVYISRSARHVCLPLCFSLFLYFSLSPSVLSLPRTPCNCYSFCVSSPLSLSLRRSSCV